MKKIATSILLITFSLISFLQAAEDPEVEAVTKKLHSIKIPVVSFQEAKVSEVVQFLQRISKKHDPEKKGVQIDLIDIKNQSKITLTRKDTSLHTLLELVAEMAELSMDVEAKGVALRKPKE